MQRSAVKLLTVADTFSILNAVLGFFAIVFAVKNSFWMAASFVLLAVLGDGADGVLARRLNSGKLGETFDSLADLTAFCIAPSIIILEDGVMDATLPFFVSLLVFYLIASIIRLSAFPVLKQKDRFLGLPVPAAGATLVLLVILQCEWYVTMSALFILSLLMISPLPFPKTGRFSSLIATLLIICTLVFKDLYNSIMPSLLLLSFLVYTALGPLYMWLHQKK
ncbi:MAG: CDP-diacylglycerol--serine O-phosphatidyltransferase [Thermoplasmata archaeon]|nr:CDP-diacylglycerol--serine O-phosphatidyltransferase [Thermoplasmata archaeon]